MRGASTTFLLLIGRDTGSNPDVFIGDTTIQHRPLPVILGSSKAMVMSDVNGLASVQPTNAGIAGPIVIQGTASIGIASLPFAAQSFGR